MTTNTNPSRTTARFFASATPFLGHYVITDRTDGSAVAAVKGRAAARSHAAALTAIDPTDVQGPRTASAASTAARTSHVDCAHVSSKLARAICRRDRKASTTSA